MRVLVCGSREWTDHLMVKCVLNGMYVEAMAARQPLVPVESLPVMSVIEGGARGAYALAGAWASRPGNGVKYLPFPPDWKKHGKAAGPIRNQRMLDEGKPDVVIAFKDGFQRDPTVTEWACKACGPHAHSGPMWCAAGCGSDYQRMDPVEVVIGRAKGGTEDMVRRAKAAGIPVYIVSHG